MKNEIQTLRTRHIQIINPILINNRWKIGHSGDKDFVQINPRRQLICFQDNRSTRRDNIGRTPEN